MQPKNGSQNRKYERLEISVKGILTIRKIQGQPVENKGNITIHVQDVSTGGIFFQSNAQLPVSPVVLYEVVFILDERRVAFKGTIQRKTTIQMGVFGYGFSFDHDSYQDFNFFYTFMQKKIVSKKQSK